MLPSLLVNTVGPKVSDQSQVNQVSRPRFALTMLNDEFTGDNAKSEHPDAVTWGIVLFCFVLGCWGLQGHVLSLHIPQNCQEASNCLR